MRIFYVVQISDHRLRAYIDAIRLLANPSEREPAHITVRGPYSQLLNPQRLEILNEFVAGERAQIVGVGHFLSRNQSTVFLRCDAPALRDVWHKAHYSEFNPHVTLYDGRSRRFASALLNRLLLYEYDVGFDMSGLVPLVSTKGRDGGFDLITAFSENYVTDVLREGFDLLTIGRKDERKRLSLIDQIAWHLSRYAVEDVDEAARYVERLPHLSLRGKGGTRTAT